MEFLLSVLAGLVSTALAWFLGPILEPLFTATTADEARAAPARISIDARRRARTRLTELVRADPSRVWALAARAILYLFLAGLLFGIVALFFYGAALASAPGFGGGGGAFAVFSFLGLVSSLTPAVLTLFKMIQLYRLFTVVAFRPLDGADETHAPARDGGEARAEVDARRRFEDRAATAEERFASADERARFDGQRHAASAERARRTLRDPDDLDGAHRAEPRGDVRRDSRFDPRPDDARADPRSDAGFDGARFRRPREGGENDPFSARQRQSRDGGAEPPVAPRRRTPPER